ncbi:hypothetical protein J7L48_00335 [bacterium]|nr:hypothetical protein [bacterium]
MKVEIFYIEKDDDFYKSYKVIKSVISEYTKKRSFKILEIQLIKVEETDVEKLRFKGHITVKINGKDIEGLVGKNNYNKRIYEWEGENFTYVPEVIFKKAVDEYITASLEVQKMKGEEPNQIC